MQVDDYYSCVMRIDVDGQDPAYLDAELGLRGEHIHIVRPSRGTRQGLDFKRWSYPTNDGGALDNWSRLEDALSTYVDRFLPGNANLASLGATDKAYWWCGCFHDNPPSLVHLSADLITRLARVCVPIDLQNYFPSSESPFAAVEPVDGESMDGPLEFNHSYRFWMSRDGLGAEQYVAEQAASDDIPVFHVFAKGLEALLEAQDDGSGHATGRVVVCEHRQYSFDGGPTFTQAHLRTLARMRLGVAIVWKL